MEFSSVIYHFSDKPRYLYYIYIYMSVDISFFEIIHYMMPWVYHGVPIITWVNIPSSPHRNSFHAGCSATALASFGGEGSQCPIEKIRNHAI